MLLVRSAVRLTLEMNDYLCFLIQNHSFFLVQEYTVCVRVSEQKEEVILKRLVEAFASAYSRSCDCVLCCCMAGLYKQSGDGACGCPGQCYAAADAAADDAFAVALPGSPHTGNPCLVCSLISSILQHSTAKHSSTGRDMHEWHSSMLHACNLAITLLNLCSLALHLAIACVYAYGISCILFFLSTGMWNVCCC